MFNNDIDKEMFINIELNNNNKKMLYYHISKSKRFTKIGLQLANEL